MPPSIYPDKAWYVSESASKGLPGHCPFANVLRCPRHHHATALLSEAGTTTTLPPELDAAATAKWRDSELFPATDESAVSIANDRMYSNFCPEVTGQTFRLFAASLIRLPEDEIDRAAHEAMIERDPGAPSQDWRASWSHVEPMHYSECPLYAQLSLEKHVPSITINGPFTGNVNIAGQTINAMTLSLSIAEVLTRIDASAATATEKESAKSKLAAFLSHPLIAAIVGGVVGGAASGG